MMPIGKSARDIMTKVDVMSQFTGKASEMDNKSRKSSRKSDHSAKATVKTKGALSRDKPKKKQFLIQRQSENLMAMFLQMCSEKKLKRAKLTKGKMKAFLVDKYGGLIAEKIVRWCSDMWNRGTVEYD